jgi:NAD(P)-dependent dehydrogenase (short-subunit alcohol dehydrogenase family)
MSDVKNEVALVTGATSGIGWAIASSLRDAGYKVFGTGRAAQPRVPDGVRAVTLDLAEPERMAAAIAPILENSGRIDVLVNNAGVMIHGAMEDAGEEAVRALWQTNYFGAVCLNKLVLPVMRANLHGTILLVSSVGTLCTPPFLGHYCASKAALQAMGASLRHEVADFGIRVATIVPGDFRSQLHARAIRYAASEPYASLGRCFDEFVSRLQQSADDPADVGRKVVAICTRARPSYVHNVGKWARRLPWLKAILPQSMFEQSVRRLLAKANGAESALPAPR